MTRLNWKLSAGLLGCGLAAVAATADPPCPAGNPLANRPCPNAKAPPVVVLPAVVPAAVVVAVHEGFALPVPVDPPKGPELPTLNLVVAEPPKPVPVPVEVPPLRLDLPPIQAAPVAAAPKVELPPLSGASTADLRPPPAPAPKIDAPAPLADTPPAADFRPPLLMTVVLKLGGGRPRFEVQAGDETLLKVASDKAEVLAPPGSPASATPTIKAAGGVRFTAPGYDGKADELSVLPDTGKVVAAGNVVVRCKTGRGETEMVAARMTFKLGSAPGYAATEAAGSGTITFNAGKK